jgi:hypothetical protein
VRLEIPPFQSIFVFMRSRWKFLSSHFDEFPNGQSWLQIRVNSPRYSTFSHHFRFDEEATAKNGESRAKPIVPGQGSMQTGIPKVTMKERDKRVLSIRKRWKHDYQTEYSVNYALGQYSSIISQYNSMISESANR